MSQALPTSDRLAKSSDQPACSCCWKHVSILTWGVGLPFISQSTNSGSPESGTLCPGPGLWETEGDPGRVPSWGAFHHPNLMSERTSCMRETSMLFRCLCEEKKTDLQLLLTFHDLSALFEGVPVSDHACFAKCFGYKRNPK